MKKRFLILMLMAFFVSILSADETIAEPDESTGVYVSCNIYGASVYIDGIYRGITPLTVTNLEPGKHRMEVSKAHHSSDIFYIIVEKGAIREAKCTLEKISGYLTVISNPEGAKVYCDGDLTGDKNIELDEGVHTITTRKFGYKDASEKINIKRNSSYTKELKMDPQDFEILSMDSGKTVFNPKDYKTLSNIEFNISVTAPGSGTLEIESEFGEIVWEQDIDFVTWDQKIKWNGKDSEDYVVEDGLYTATLKVGEKSASYTFVVDSKIVYPMLEATPSGLGIGPVSSAQLYPKSTLLLSFESGAIFKTGDSIFYGVPLNASIAWTPSKYFELMGSFMGIAGDGFKFGADITAKLVGVGSFGSEQVNYGLVLRYGDGSSTLMPPYGYDYGRGFGAGVVFGYLINDFYLGLESTYIFRPVSGMFTSEGTESIWKNGLLASKNFDSGSLALYASLAAGFGTFKKGDESVDISAGVRALDLGGRFAFYILGTKITSSRLSFGLRGGVVIYPEEGGDSFFSEGGTFYPYVKAALTWVL
ncbi:MAG: PEGA domain-containing protein [Treponema sp.]|nr:PEGA domain-containing protein [Treponema sp.]